MPEAQGRFALRLASNDVSHLSDADGGAIYADVRSQVHGSEPFARKRLGPPKYGDFSLRVGASMSRGLSNWLATSWAAQAPKRNGSLLTLGNGLAIHSEQIFTGALIAETTFPALDGALRDVAEVTVRFAPELVRFKKGEGMVPPAPERPKVWTASNFRLEIDGLDCRRVTRIDSFTVKRRLTAVYSASGETTLSAGIIDFPNLTITLSENGASSWYDWHDDFVVQGHNDDSRERNGVLRLLSPNLTTELARLEFSHLGIIKLTRRAVGGVSPVPRVTAELYCEQMKFNPGGGGA